MLTLYALKINPEMNLNSTIEDGAILTVKPFYKSYPEMRYWLQDIYPLSGYEVRTDYDPTWYGNPEVFKTLQEVVKEVSSNNEKIKKEAMYFYDYPPYEEFMGYYAIENIALSLDYLYHDIKDFIWTSIMDNKINSNYYSNKFLLWKDTMSVYKEIATFFKIAHKEKKIVVLSW